MSPLDFLEVAGELATGMREADWRSAVSRAYYAAFHVARKTLRQCGFAVPQGDQAHSYLWLRLSNCGHPDIQYAGANLSLLRAVRNRADYDLDQFFPHDHAFSQVQVASDIIQMLEAASASPTVRTQITDAIKKYERDVLREVTWHP